MGFKTGIVGLPNVGKSTLFNALTQSTIAQAENFPFCTIEPNIGDVVPDDRLNRLAKLQIKTDNPSQNVICRYCWVGGASKGEGWKSVFGKYKRM